MQEKIAKKLLEKVKNDYDEISSEFDQTRHHDWKEFKEFLTYIKDGDKLADLGCGNGRFYNFICDKKKIDYTGVDNSKKLLEKATKNHPKTRFVAGDLIDIPLKNNSIDVAVAIASFHHLPSKKLREKSLHEIHRILKKDGTFIITVWNLFQPKYKKYIWKSRIKALMTLGKYDMRDTLIPWGKSGVNRYYYAFKEKELRNLLEKNGFSVIESSIGNNILFICRKDGSTNG